MSDENNMQSPAFQTPQARAARAKANGEYVWTRLELIQKLRFEIKETIELHNPDVPQNAMRRDCETFNKYLVEMGLKSWAEDETKGSQ
jgi:hypothetical protein